MISVVIPLYNKENAIVNTLKSVLAQTFTDYECIIVNDGSKDNSRDVVKAWIASNQAGQFRLINKENGGVCSARNRGVLEAHGDFIALLDGDDLWDKDFLNEQYRLICDFPRAAMWGVNYAFIKGENCWACNQGLCGYRGYVVNYFGTKHNDLFCSSSVVIRKSVFENVGYFDERISYSEDLDMWYRIILDNPVVYYDKVLAFYNQNADNRCAYDLRIHYDLSRYQPYYIDKYKKRFEENTVFANYVCDRAARVLLSNRYYFGDKEDRVKSKKVIDNLSYRNIHPKYWFIFKTPRCIGWVIYKIVMLKKWLMKK